MKRRRAPTTLLLSIGSAFIASPVDATLLLDEYNLRVRPEIKHELDFLSDGEFAPLPPTHARMNRSMLRQQERGTAGSSDCSSPLVAWTTNRVYEMGYHKYKELFDNQIILMPYVYKHYIEKNDGRVEYFVSDSQTKELKRRHDDTIAFWTEADIDNSIMTDDILLLSMHGSVLKDTDKLIPTIMRMFNFNEMSDVLSFAAKVQSIVAALPDGFDNPLLSMNAVATRSTHKHGTYNGHEDSSRRIKDSIVIGDGVLQFLYEEGLGASGPDFVYAHEFGHHLQFQLDMAVPPGSAYVHDERRKELMADAISGYFLAHDRGGDMLAEEIGIFDRTAFATGDCSLGREDHHGTPSQRQCAAIWGASLAAPDHVPILDPEVFVSSFNQIYGMILDLNARECTLVLEDTTSFDYDPWEHKEDLQNMEEATPSVWDNADYQEEGKPSINLGDWLESQEDKDPKDDLEWQDSWYTEWEDPESGETIRHPSQNDNVPQDEVISSLMPIEDTNSWESRGKPSSHVSDSNNHKDSLGSRPNNYYTAQSPSSIEVVTEGGNTPVRIFADRGKMPGETKNSYLDGNMLSTHDCRMPWVYCESSSRRLRTSGILYMALAAVSSFAMMMI